MPVFGTTNCEVGSTILFQGNGSVSDDVCVDVVKPHVSKLDSLEPDATNFPFFESDHDVTQENNGQTNSSIGPTTRNKCTLTNQAEFPLDLLVECREYAKKLQGAYPRILEAKSDSEESTSVILHAVAFCDALMGDNQKTKRLLKEAQQKVETLKTENEQLKQKFPAVIPSTSKVLTTTTVNQKASTSANMLDTSEMSLVLKLQARVKKLETQRTEILRVNKAWDTQYKCLKQELDRRTRDGECSQRNREKDDTRSYNDVDFSAAKREIRTHIHEKSDLARNYANAHAQCQKLKGEMVHLKDSIRKYKSDKSYLEAENQRLTQALEAAHSFHERQSLPSQPDDLLLAMVGNRNHGKKFNLIMADETYNQLPSSPLSPIQEVREPSSSNLFRSNPEIDDLRTKIEVLQEQVKIYREDFETERRDREKTQSEKQRFEELLTKAKHQVQALTQQLNTHQHDFRQEKRDKERLQRQLEWANARDPTNAQNRDRHNDDLNDPPAYYAHRFTGNDDVLNGFNNVSRRRMRQHNY